MPAHDGLPPPWVHTCDGWLIEPAFDNPKGFSQRQRRAEHRCPGAQGRKTQQHLGKATVSRPVSRPSSQGLARSCRGADVSTAYGRRSTTITCAAMTCGPFRGKSDSLIKGHVV